MLLHPSQEVLAGVGFDINPNRKSIFCLEKQDSITDYEGRGPWILDDGTTGYQLED